MRVAAACDGRSISRLKPTTASARLLVFQARPRVTGARSWPKMVSIAYKIAVEHEAGKLWSMTTRATHDHDKR
jgi:hypothetical protein